MVTGGGPEQYLPIQGDVDLLQWLLFLHRTPTGTTEYSNLALDCSLSPDQAALIPN